MLASTSRGSLLLNLKTCGLLAPTVTRPILWLIFLTCIYLCGAMGAIPGYRGLKVISSTLMCVQSDDTAWTQTGFACRIYTFKVNSYSGFGGPNFASPFPDVHTTAICLIFQEATSWKPPPSHTCASSITSHLAFLLLGRVLVFLLPWSSINSKLSADAEL